MNRALLFLLCLLCAPWARAANPTNQGNVTLGWDRSPDDTLTNGLAYRIYAATNASFAGAVVAYTGTNTATTITNLTATRWFFQSTAIQGGIESDPSSVTIYTVPVVKPRPPGSTFVIHLESTLNFTNWTDMGGFRAVLQTWP